MHIVIATSTSDGKKEYAKKTLMTYLESKGIQEVQCSLENIYTVSIDILNEADLVIAIGPTPAGLTTVSIDGTAFIAKIPSFEQQVCHQILEKVQEIQGKE